MATIEQPKANVPAGGKSRVFRNFIAGEWVDAASGQTFENVNPADTREVVGIFQRSGQAEVDAAVAAAGKAFEKWRLTPAPRRAEIIFRAASILEQRKEQFARDMTREMGKVLKETRGDVQEAIDTGYYMAGEGRRLFRLYHAERASQQVCHVRAPAHRGLRDDYALELSDGDSVVEAFPRAGGGQHLRHQARAGHAAFGVQFCRGASRSRRPGRRGQYRHRLRRRSRRPAGRAS